MAFKLPIKVGLGKYEVRIYKTDLLVAMAVVVVLSGVATGFALRSDQSQSAITPNTTSDDRSTEPNPDVVVVPPTTPIEPPLKRNVSSSNPSTTAKPLNDPATCDPIIAQYEPQLDDLDVQIKEQLKIMNDIINSSELMPGGMLHQAEMTQKFNAANDKANTLMAQRDQLDNEYTNKLLGAGCTDKLDELLY